MSGWVGTTMRTEFLKSIRARGARAVRWIAIRQIIRSTNEVTTMENKQFPTCMCRYLIPLLCSKTIRIEDYHHSKQYTHSQLFHCRQ